MKSLKRKLFSNASWLIATKLIQSFLSAIVTVFSARFLGPSNYGLVSYAASIISFVAPIALLGLSNVQVQEYINHPNEEGKILGSSIVMSLCSSIICIFGAVFFSLFANYGELETTLIVLLYSIMLIFQSTELIMYWFQAKFLNKYYAIVGLAAYIIISAYKIVLLSLGLDIKLFAIANALDYFLISFALFFIYKIKGEQTLRFDKDVAKRLFNNCKHYIIPNLMISIFTQTDHIMIKHLIGDEAVGIYTVATVCAGYANFVFIAIIDAARPSIFENRKISEDAFEQSTVNLYSIVIYLALAFGIAMMFLSPFIIKILYGTDYLASVTSLIIVSWFPLFSYLGSVRNIWILAKQRQKYLWIVNFFGACSNILLNLALIPNFGIEGAAIASLITQILTNLIFTCLFKPYRRNVVLMIKGLNPKHIINCLRK